ncbi:MAG: diphosphomevalonate decarboxylase [Bacteroidetes bacterium]|nr:MAG: diphosphomevalonate decarboxylase [Bacteroidota bacterium]
MDYHNPRLIVESSIVPDGAIRWRSPSNIALVKYWGKYGNQLPRNPSISLTLSAAATDTTLHYGPKQTNKDVELEFSFAGEARPDFAEKIAQYLRSLIPVFPFIRQFHFRIESSNSFPHSAGIASSASAMSALALCLCSLEQVLFGTLEDLDDFFQKASYLARLGSGSACRSVYPYVAVWGETSDIPGSSNLYAIPYAEQVHEVFHTYHDDILIISKAEKSVSSRAGHALMEGNIYADNRYLQARQRLGRLSSAMRTGDLETFGEITEAEALTLHALMMTSLPPYLLLEANSLIAIRKVQAWRKDTGLPLYFTLDAGPNLHLLYPNNIAEEAKQFIRTELAPLCHEQVYIADRCGIGPEQLEASKLS